jgi:hypothetical protein
LKLDHSPANHPGSATDSYSAGALSKYAQQLATIGFILYAAFAPHSIAAAEISLAIVGAGWLLRTLLTAQDRLPSHAL